ncbi:hypothetical protein HA075_21695 [bacterium BFN5]|nr:hypothetical protein HA075_21695 [bacterium BFN5]
MVYIDLIGLVITILVIGIRYPHYGVAAVLIHEFGRVAMTVFLHGQVESVVTAGVFSTAVVSNSNFIMLALIGFAGPLTNFIICSTSGGIAFERTISLLDPRACLRNPFAVVNLRLALFSCLFNIRQFLS